MKKTLLISALILGNTTTYALAQENQIHGFVAMGAFAMPEYEGSEDYQFNPVGAARVQYKHYYFQTEGLGAKVNISPLENFEFGPAFNYRMKRDNDIENKKVSRMKQVDGTFEGGGFARIQQRNLMSGGDEIGFEVKALTDTSDVHEGTIVTFGPDYAFQATDKLRLSTSLKATYADEGYMDAYFGISSKNRGNSGFSNFNPSGGIKDAGISMMANYQFNEKWGAIGIAGYNKLLGDAKDSPLVADEGNDNQFMALTGVTYRF